MFFDFKFGTMKIKVNDHLHLMENLVPISNFRIFIQLNLHVLIKHVLIHYTFWKHAVPIIH